MAWQEKGEYDMEDLESIRVPLKNYVVDYKSSAYKAQYPFELPSTVTDETTTHGGVIMPKEMDAILARIQETEQGLAKGKVVKIEEGKVSDWIPKDSIVGDKSRAEAKAIRMFIETPDGYTTQSPIMRYSSHPRSHMYAFVTKYGPPSEGQEVDLVLDTQGFWKLDIPTRR